MHKSEMPAPVLGWARLSTGTLLGLDFQAVTVEVVQRRGPTSFQLAGLAEAAVREARVRVQSAMLGMGLHLDEYSLTVSLAPADLRKSGAGLDLSLALGILSALGQCGPFSSSQLIVLGELGLDGSVRPVRGLLPLLAGARAQGRTEAIIPADNKAEAACVKGLRCFPVRTLSEAVAFSQGKLQLAPVSELEFASLSSPEDEAFEPVRGQFTARRALMVAAAGSHHLLMSGPPGSGKTLLSRQLPRLLPKLSFEESLEVTSIHSISGLLGPGQALLSAPPFRAPHHTVSEVGLVGGGERPRPGEISLAHRGVLFLDELPEFQRRTLECLRQPLEDGRVQIVRAHHKTSFPSAPLLVAAMNPCPCGYAGDPRQNCRCSPEQKLKYLARLSGPLLDRIDLQISVPPVELKTWLTPDTAGHDDFVKQKRLVLAAREAQQLRFQQGEVKAPRNRELDLAELERVAAPQAAGKKLLQAAVEHFALSARAYVRVLRVARTLADLEGRDAVTGAAIAEALQYRRLDVSGTNSAVESLQ